MTQPDGGSNQGVTYQVQIYEQCVYHTISRLDELIKIDGDVSTESVKVSGR